MFLMRKKGKKYILKESELREIVLETILMEVYNSHDYDHLYTKDYAGKRMLPRDYVERLAKIGGGVGTDLINKLSGGLTNLLLGVGDGGLLPVIGGTPLVPPKIQRENSDASEPLNVSAAVRWLNSWALPQYDKDKCGRCAAYVRGALNVGGLSAPHKMNAEHAKDYIQVLPNNGWDEIPQNSAGAPGDVMVIDSCVDSSRVSHPYGHIAMCLGNGKWAADYHHGPGNLYGLTGTPPPKAVHFYRYRNRV